MDKTLEHSSTGVRATERDGHTFRVRNGILVVAAACLVFLLGSISPPHLMDDVDAVQAQIGRNMLESGDWVTARLNHVAYLEKAPLIYWMFAASYRVFGVHDWAARLPLVLSVVLLCWVAYRFGHWGLGERAGLYTGLVLATSTGLFLFTRILIPDAILTLTITLALWSWVRLLDPEEPHARRWSVLLGVSIGLGILLKALIGIVFPVGIGLLYMAITGSLFSRQAWSKLHLLWAIIPALVIAAPWHILATLANPPYFNFSLHSGPGEYHGFFWFFFFNEQLLRFLNLRYPRDYDTVPRPLFWILQMVWLFPWSAYLPAAIRLSYRPATREARVHLLALCWIAVVMIFFSFSTTQEYYSMPIYPALALLIGSSLAKGGAWVKAGNRVLLAVSVVLFVVLGGILVRVHALAASGDISQALTQNPEMYTLSLGHMTDLTLAAFAYLKLPLALAATSFLLLALAMIAIRKNQCRIVLCTAASMILFFQAAHIALVRFDGYLGSYPLAEALIHAPKGELIEADAYYAFSSVFFYTNRSALLWNGRSNNLEYGSYAPNAPHVFIGDSEFVTHWRSPNRCYLLMYGSDLPKLNELVGKENTHVVRENAGNFLLSNQAL